MNGLTQALNDRSGLVRAIVEDSNDPTLVSYTLDSDGTHNVNTPATADSEFKNVSDGTWHMVTITTHTDRTRGFLLYVDGQMAGKPQSKFSTHMLCFGFISVTIKLSRRPASRPHLW